MDWLFKGFNTAGAVESSTNSELLAGRTPEETQALLSTARDYSNEAEEWTYSQLQHAQNSFKNIIKSWFPFIIIGMLSFTLLIIYFPQIELSIPAIVKEILTIASWTLGVFRVIKAILEFRSNDEDYQFPLAVLDLVIFSVFCVLAIVEMLRYGWMMNSFGWFKEVVETFKYGRHKCCAKPLTYKMQSVQSDERPREILMHVTETASGNAVNLPADGFHVRIREDDSRFQKVQCVKVPLDGMYLFKVVKSWEIATQLDLFVDFCGGEKKHFIRYANRAIFCPEENSHDRGTVWYPNGCQYVGEWQGKRQGVGKLMDSAGKVIDEGKFDDDFTPSSLAFEFLKAQQKEDVVMLKHLLESSPWKVQFSKDNFEQQKIIGRASITTGNLKQAQDVFTHQVSVQKGTTKGEALYYLGLANRYLKSNKQAKENFSSAIDYLKKSPRHEKIVQDADKQLRQLL
jgi:hypothetical protein